MSEEIGNPVFFWEVMAAMDLVNRMAKDPSTTDDELREMQAYCEALMAAIQSEKKRRGEA